MPELISCRPTPNTDLEDVLNQDVIKKYKNTIQVLRDENELLLQDLKRSK